MSPAPARPDVLLLDDPTNHLDAASVSWLEQHLKQYRDCHPPFTHDRYFLDNVPMDPGADRGEGIPWKGNYSSCWNKKHKNAGQEEKTESNAIVARS